MKKEKVFPKPLSDEALTQVTDPFQRAQIELLYQITKQLDTIGQQLSSIDSTLMIR